MILHPAMAYVVMSYPGKKHVFPFPPLPKRSLPPIKIQILNLNYLLHITSLTFLIHFTSLPGFCMHVIIILFLQAYNNLFSSRHMCFVIDWLLSPSLRICFCWMGSFGEGSIFLRKVCYRTKEVWLLQF